MGDVIMTSSEASTFSPLEVDNPFVDNAHNCGVVPRNAAANVTSSEEKKIDHGNRLRNRNGIVIDFSILLKKAQNAHYVTLCANQVLLSQEQEPKTNPA